MGFLDSMKKGAAHAQLEADKLVRINRIQGQINALKQQLRRKIVRLGEKTLELYRAGQLSEEDLIVLCEGIAGLEKEIAAREEEIEAIRQKSLSKEEVVAPATDQLCPECKTSLPEGAGFCPNCGSKTVDKPSPAVENVAAKCPNCGATLVEETMFCLQCGTKIEREREAVELSDLVCPECRSPLPENAELCPNCGTRVEKEQTPISETITAPEEEADTPSEINLTS